MKPVTLWVDAIGPKSGGISRYTWELAKGLSSRDDLAVQFFARNQVIEDPALLVRGDPLPRRPNKLRRWWDQRALVSSIIHGPNYFLPSFAEAGIITVHDLSVFRFPETHPAERIAAFEREFPSSLARAVHVITDTETVRRELIETFNVSPESVTAVPLGVDPAFRPMPVDELAPSLEWWGLQPKHYGLCVSTIEPRKRISQLLAAWRRLPRSLRDSYPLVLCGGAGWQNETLRSEIEDGVTEGWLRYLGFVEEALLPQLYAGAALFIYPSIYEGFGLPPVEAMASGVPVMVSSHSCLPEVCGDAARYVDPDDADGFAMALEQNLTDGDWRTASVRRGLSRALELSWERCVDRTVEIYQKVASAA